MAGLERTVHAKLKGEKPAIITGGYIDRNDERLEDGFCYVSGRVQLASGKVLPAVLDLCIRDGGEHYGTLVVIKQKLFDLHDEKLLKRLGELGIKVFPYKYNYDPEIPADVHIRSMPEIRRLTPKEARDLRKAIDDFEATGKIYEVV